MKKVLLVLLAVFLYTGASASDKKEKDAIENNVEVSQLNVLLTPTKLNAVKSVKAVFREYVVCTTFDYRPNGSTWVTEIYTIGGQIMKRVYDTYHNPTKQPHQDGEITAVEAIKHCNKMK